MAEKKDATAKLIIQDDYRKEIYSLGSTHKVGLHIVAAARALGSFALARGVPDDSIIAGFRYAATVLEAIKIEEEERQNA